MTSSTVYAKALRYINDGRCELLIRHNDTIIVKIEGDHGAYIVTGDNTGYQCPCPATTTCAHIIATEAIAHHVNTRPHSVNTAKLHT
jgi:hypothetical protein